MAKYTANIMLIMDVFEAENGVQAGDIVNNYITELANVIEAANVAVDLAWNDCDFFIYEETEDE